MSGHLDLSCTCGKLRGEARDLDAKDGNHVVCYCKDCQAYAHVLGRASHILDADGGTEIFQTWPSKIHFFEGQDQLQCLRLSEKGLHRWYARCCKTPVANSSGNARLPIMGILSPIVRAVDGRSLTTVVGPIVGGFGTSRQPELAAKYGKGENVPFALRTLRWVAKGFVRGAQRGPFFDSAGRPVATPVVVPRGTKAP